MDTHTATRILAEIAQAGAIVTPELRVAALGDQHPHGSHLLSSLVWLIETATAQGRDGKWNAAESYIARAYRQLSAEPPAGLTAQGPGYDWHRGTHAIQRAKALA